MEPHRAAPPRPQHLEALDRANLIRRRRYAIRRRVKDRRLSLTALFTPEGLEAHDAELLAGREIKELLEWGYRVGDTVSRRILKHAEVKPILSLEALSEQRRAALVEFIEQIAPEACTGADHVATADLDRDLEPADAGPGTTSIGLEARAA